MMKPDMMKPDRIFAITAMIAAPLILSIALIACDNPGAKKAAEDEAAATEAAAMVFAVNTTTATRGQIRDYLLLSGDIVSGSTVDAYSDVAGKVTKLYVSVGDKVQKDDPLAEIDPSRPGMSFIPGVAKAPIAGTIVALPAQLGMTISQAVPVARLSRTDALELRTYVAERFVSKVRVGLRAEVGLDAYPGKTFIATVSELSPVLDPASRTMEIRLNLVRPDSSIKAGMFAKIKVITQDKPDIVKIPANAVVHRFGESYVFALEPDPADPARILARRRLVVPGILIDDKLEIREGLKAGEEIVVRGQTLLEDGSPVNVVERLAPLPVAD
ncbi:MAG: efflux RND transporter periplasmic adaptor subunit [Spirochaetia bacterium]|jgi:multidrug efflux pump subunit AcrA (membrane-fusion protein)|nr:efflux RND transporter periplasmic adaptor subunit [Spirochaetia bacterium]